MNEPKQIKNDRAGMAINPNDPIVKILRKCPYIQAELLKQNRVSLRDDEVNALIKCALLEDWIDNQDVMLTLHISIRTLQSLRSNGTLPYSRIGNKIYYRRQDILKILSDSYIIHKLRDHENK